MTIDTKTAPLVIFGLDAGEADLIERWAEEGYLPTIESILKRGCWGRITGPEQISEHGVWVSLFSGVSRGQHGYYYWRPLKPGTYKLQLTNLQDLGALPFWSCLRGRDTKAAIIDPPESYPLTGVPGVQIGNWAPHNPRFATCTEPASLLHDLRMRFGPQMNIEEKVGSNFTKDRQIYRGLLKQIEQKGSLCRYLITRDHFNLLVVVFFESHISGHQFLKYSLQARGANSATAKNELANAMRDVYQAIDQQMGLLLSELPSKSNVFIVSNVGLQEDYPTKKLIEAFCRQLGYQVPAESSSLSFSPLTWARHMIPEAWRVALSSYLPRETRERLLAEQFRCGTHWLKTTAFAIPSLYTSFLRVNLRGREPEGIVEPGRQYEELLDKLEADLKQLADPQTGRPAVNQIARAVELFGGGPPVSLPDLFVEWTPTQYIKRRVVHPKAVLVQEDLDYSRGSHHTHHGFIAAAGPFIKEQGALHDIDVLDLAPTFLSLMGESVPQYMSGQIIESVVQNRQLSSVRKDASSFE